MPVALVVAATLGGALGVAGVSPVWEQLDGRALWSAWAAVVLAGTVFAATSKLGKAGVVPLLASLAVLLGGLAAALAIGFGAWGDLPGESSGGSTETAALRSEP